MGIMVDDSHWGDEEFITSYSFNSGGSGDVYLELSELYDNYMSLDYLSSNEEGETYKYRSDIEPKHF